MCICKHIHTYIHVGIAFRSEVDRVSKQQTTILIQSSFLSAIYMCTHILNLLLLCLKLYRQNIKKKIINVNFYLIVALYTTTIILKA